MVLFLCVGLGVLPLQPAALAQGPQETALARALFEEGVSLADQAKWPEAVDRFRRAQSLKPTPGIAFNLASALGENGQIIEASELLESLVRDPATPPELKQECETKLAELSSRRSYLTLRVEDAPSDASVQVDGREWPRVAWGVASPLDPGSHLVVGSSGGEEATRAQVEVAVGERRELSLSWPKAVVGPTNAAAEAAPVAAPVAPTHQDRKPLYKSWILWTCVGAVIAGGVVAGVVLASKGDATTEAPIPGNAGVIRW